MIAHDELCIGALKAGMCDCDFIAKVRENQIERDMLIVEKTPTKGGRGRWLLKSKVTFNLCQQHLDESTMTPKSQVKGH